MPDRLRMMRFLEGLVRKNLGLKLLAFAVAAGLWWFVAAESHIQVGFVVPLEIRNLPERMAITNRGERQGGGDRGAGQDPQEDRADVGRPPCRGGGGPPGRPLPDPGALHRGGGPRCREG